MSAENGSASAEEYSVKAAFLYNFAKFTEWPSRALESPHAIVLGVVGPDPFGSALERMLQGKTLNGKGFQIKRFPSPQNLELCHILFINLSDKKQLEAVLHVVRGSPVLTVGESDDFLRLGGVVRLFIENHRVRFDVNVNAAQRVELRISSQLLKLAREVRRR